MVRVLLPSAGRWAGDAKALLLAERAPWDCLILPSHRSQRKELIEDGLSLDRRSEVGEGHAEGGLDIR